jgi:hypothetical protein
MVMEVLKGILGKLLEERSSIPSISFLHLVVEYHSQIFRGVFGSVTKHAVKHSRKQLEHKTLGNSQICWQESSNISRWGRNQSFFPYPHSKIIQALNKEKRKSIPKQTSILDLQSEHFMNMWQ